MPAPMVPRPTTPTEEKSRELLMRRIMARTLATMACWLDCAREIGRCSLSGRLRRTAHRTPADGHPTADGEERRLRTRALRRRFVQAAELDVPGVQGGRGRQLGRGRRVVGYRQGR